MKTKSIHAFLALFFSFLIPFNQVQANQMFFDGSSQIQEILNEFDYSMSVIWDQRDPVFRKQVERRFMSQLVELTQRGSLKQK